MVENARIPYTKFGLSIKAVALDRRVPESWLIILFIIDGASEAVYYTLVDWREKNVGAHAFVMKKY